MQSYKGNGELYPMNNFALIHKEVSKVSRQYQAMDKEARKVASYNRQLLLYAISIAFDPKDSEKAIEFEKRRILRKNSF
ncbi:MAG: hypothetical protein OXN27_24905 [Candidatus Poribacteria bacterium]|nr:hypothetical protein [Candidatus Poribacteria bacterium]